MKKEKYKGSVLSAAASTTGLSGNIMSDGGDVVEAFSGKAVHAGHAASHIGLLQVVKCGSFFRNSPQDEVIVFHLAFWVCRLFAP